MYAEVKQNKKWKESKFIGHTGLMCNILQTYSIKRIKRDYLRHYLHSVMTKCARIGFQSIER